jgi:magnesium chelatase family protein
VAMPDLQDTKGQETAKRALEVAAAGGHNLLMIGPPLEPSEMLEVSMIRSLAGDLAGGRIGRTRPFRAPHHSASMAAAVGAASASSFSTSCRSSIRKSSTRCASRSRPARR